MDFLLIIEMAKIELIGGHFEFFAYYRDGQNRINRRPYWIYCIYIDYQNEIVIILIIEMAKKELIGGYIGFMLITEMAKIELIGGHIGFNVLI